jgi:single-strand DNA-binding protein
MASLNRVILIGNVGRDPEVRTMQSGDRVVNFSLATTESWKDKNTGERKDKTEWHQITVWNEHIGKVVEQYVKKGSQIYIEGQIQSRKYQDKDGNERTAFEIVLQRFRGELVMLGGKGDGSRDGDEKGPDTPATRPTREVLDDDIPF